MITDDELVVRDTVIDGVGNWLWLKEDDGAWDGPHTDWRDNHSTKYFERVEKYDVCVQAGGCQGMYPRLLAERFKHVYTFEPDPRNFFVLVQNCSSPSIHKFNSALGFDRGMVSLNRPAPNNVGMHMTQVGGEEMIPTIRIDDLGLPSCDFICLDMERAEFGALLGGVETIEKFHPVISIEMPSEEIRAWLTDRGYAQSAQSVSDAVFVYQG